MATFVAGLQQVRNIPPKCRFHRCSRRYLAIGFFEIVRARREALRSFDTGCGQYAGADDCDGR